MITRHVGGELVRGGVYWSMNGGEFVQVPPEGAKLEGSADHRYIKAPLPIVLVAGPVMGLAFAMFLPLSGLLVLVPFLGGKIRGVFSSSKVTVAHAAGSRMQPGLSYLEPGAKAEAGTPATGTEKARATEQDDKLVDLAEDIAEKRWQDK